MTTKSGPVAFVLGGGGILGASEVGMLEALLGSGIRPDLVVGTSVGAVNGAFLAADPTSAAVERLADVWVRAAESGVFTDSFMARVQRVGRLASHLHSSDALESLLAEELDGVHIEDLAVRFQCVAAQIETASAWWFSRGSVVDAVLASCAVPGLLPAREIDGMHYLDGGLVHSIPVSRAIDLGARTVYVLQVGRIEHALREPRWPWEVGLVAFEIARRYRFNEDLERVPEGVAVHVLPSGSERSPSMSMSYRGAASGGRADRRAAAVLRGRCGGRGPPRASPAAARRVVRDGIPLDRPRDAPRLLVAVAPTAAAQPRCHGVAGAAYGAAAGARQGIALDGGVSGGGRCRPAPAATPAAAHPRPACGSGRLVHLGQPHPDDLRPPAQGGAQGGVAVGPRHRPAAQPARLLLPAVPDGRRRRPQRALRAAGGVAGCRRGAADLPRGRQLDTEAARASGAVPRAHRSVRASQGGEGGGARAAAAARRRPGGGDGATGPRCRGARARRPRPVGHPGGHLARDPGRPMSIHWWVAESGTIPSDRAGILTWMEDVWGQVDAWVEAEHQQPVLPTPPLP